LFTNLSGNLTLFSLFVVHTGCLYSKKQTYEHPLTLARELARMFESQWVIDYASLRLHISHVSNHRNGPLFIHKSSQFSIWSIIEGRLHAISYL